MSRGKRIALIALAGTLATLLLLVIAAFALLRSDGGQGWIKTRIEAAVSAPDGPTLSLDRLDGALPGELIIEGVALGDAEGVWLAADRIELDWRPLALLGGRLPIETLRIETLRIARAPVSTEEPAETTEPFEIPELPVALTLSRLEIARLELGEALLGEAAALRVTGMANAEQASGISTRLEIARLDGVEGRIDLDATLEPSSEQLTLALNASEPPDGVIARLLALPDLPAVSLSLQGDGPLADWQGAVSGQVEGLADWRGTLQLAVTEPSQAVALAGDVALSLDPTSPFSALAGNGLRYDLAAQLDQQESLTIERLSLESAALTLGAAGTLALEDMTADLTAQLALKQPQALASLLPDVALAPTKVEATARGPLLEPTVSIAAETDAVGVSGAAAEGLLLRLDLAPETALTDPAAVVGLKGDAKIARLQVEGMEALQPTLDAGLQLDLDGRFDLGSQSLDPLSLTLTGDTVAASASGALSLDEPAARLALDIALDDLGRLAPLAGLPLAGKAVARSEIDAGANDPEITLPITLEIASLSLGEPAAEALLGPSVNAAVRVTRAADGALRLSDLALDGSGVSLQANAAFGPGFDSLTADYSAALPDLAVLTPALETVLAGQLALSGQASGSLADPSVTLEVTGDALSAAGLQLARAEVQATADRLVSGPTGRLEAKLQPSGPIDGPVALSTDFQLQQDALELRPIDLRAQKTRIDGGLRLNLASALASGDLKGTIGDLGPWLALAGLEGGGSGSLAVTLQASGERQAAKTRLDLKALSLTTPDGPAVSAAALQAEAESGDVAALQGSAKITVSQARLDERLIEQIALTAKGGTEALDFTLTAANEKAPSLRLDSAGQLALRDDGLSVTLSRLDGRAEDQDFALGAPLVARQSGDRLALEGLDLTLAGGRVTGAAARDGARVEANLDVAALPLSLLGTLAGLEDLEGQLDAQVSLQGAAPAPRGSAKLSVSELSAGQLADAPPLQVDIEADWVDQRLALDGNLSGFGETPAALSLNAPLRLDPVSLTPVLDGAQPLQGRLAWQGPVERIWSLVPVADQELSGAAALQAEIGGTLDRPRADGSLTITEGRYVNASSGTLLTGLDLSVALADQQVTIERFTAADGGAGRLSVTGQATLDPEQGLPFSVTSDLQDFTAVRRDEVTAALSGAAAVEGSLEATTIKGALESRGVEVRIPDQLPPQVVELEVREVNRAAAGLPAEPSDAEESGGAAVDLDIGVDLPGKVFVRGRGLDSEWQGNLRVSGSADAPVILGKLSLVRGQIAVLARDFELTTGEITFPGEADADPLLNIVAENETDDVTVAVRLFGAASRPELELTSRPELPQDEILARVLFGKRTTQLSPVEALQLAAAAAELSGKGGPGVLDFARDLVGVDVLRVESGDDGSGTPALAAGKYVTDKVFVGVKRGAEQGSGSAAVEIEVYPNVLLESGVGQRGSSNLGVKFEWDY